MQMKQKETQKENMCTSSTFILYNLLADLTSIYSTCLLMQPMLYYISICFGFVAVPDALFALEGDGIPGRHL